MSSQQQGPQLGSKDAPKPKGKPWWKQILEGLATAIGEQMFGGRR